MKRIIPFVFAIAMAFSAISVSASDLEIVMIGPDSEPAAPMSLDDMQLNTSYTIDGYATVMPVEFLTVDYFAQFGENEDYGTWHNGDWNIWQVASYGTSDLGWGSWRFNDAVWQESKENAQFVWLAMDITNLQKKTVNYMDELSVKVFYQDDYEFTGWVRQIENSLISKETSDFGVSRYGGNKEDYPNAIVLNPEKPQNIDMLYTGRFVMGCTLPNYVVNDKKSPLRMEINLGGNELTYHIIKG